MTILINEVKLSRFNATLRLEQTKTSKFEIVSISGKTGNREVWTTIDNYEQANSDFNETMDFFEEGVRNEKTQALAKN